MQISGRLMTAPATHRDPDGNENANSGLCGYGPNDLHGSVGEARA
jgi:hypothetical protein